MAKAERLVPKKVFSQRQNPLEGFLLGKIFKKELIPVFFQ
jgi:hypothetical protein